MRGPYIAASIFLLLFCIRCKDKNSREESNSKMFIREVKTNFDTLNSGEKFEISIISDSSYYLKFRKYPIVEYNGYSIPLEYTNYSLKFDTYSEATPSTILKKTIDFKIRYKLDQLTDTLLPYQITYYIKNVESSERTQGKLIDGKKQGLWRFWYDNNRFHIKEESFWNNGKREGNFKSYWMNGNISKTADYVFDTLAKPPVTYNSAGENQ